MWTARVFTLYPELFPGPLNIGLYKKALEKKLWSLEVVNIREYASDKHKTVDDTPFGGGSGMLMRADVIANSLDKNILDKISDHIESNTILTDVGSSKLSVVKIFSKLKIQFSSFLPSKSKKFLCPQAFLYLVNGYPSAFMLIRGVVLSLGNC